MLWITLALIALTLWADHRGARRFGLPGVVRLLCWATDLLPLAAVGLYALLPDNPTPVVLTSMWLFFAYLLLVIPRMTFYLVALAGRGRGVRLAALAAALAVAAVLLAGCLHTRTDYTVRHVTLRSQRLPAAFDGLRIAQISDLHIGSMVRPEVETRRIVERVNALHPDMVIFSGDLANIRYTELTDTIMELLGALHSPYGTFSVTGNHDIGKYVRDTVALPFERNLDSLIARERRMGWHVLDNQTVRLTRDSAQITLTGISFDPAMADLRHDAHLPQYDFGTAYDDVPHDLFNVTIAHLPQLWEPILSRGYGDVTLSGHVHSMQFKIPLGRRGISPARLMYDRWSGLYEAEGKYLYINDGTGCVGAPLRIGARPEITLIELRQ